MGGTCVHEKRRPCAPVFAFPENEFSGSGIFGELTEGEEGGQRDGGTRSVPKRFSCEPVFAKDFLQRHSVKVTPKGGLASAVLFLNDFMSSGKSCVK